MANLIFDSLTAPNGVAFDNNGNFYLASLASVASIVPGIPPTQATIFKFDPSGNLIGELPVMSFANPKLEFVPELNLLVSIEENGQLLLIDPTTLSITGSINLNQLPVDASTVLDITTNTLQNLSGFIQSGTSTYGDFDIRVVDNRIQFFISGQSQAQSFPFVLRVTLENGELAESRVLFSSTADAQSIAPQSPRLSRGIAVNPQGTVLTTLPLPSTQQPLDFVVAFNADVEVADGIGENELLFVNNQVDVYSQGLTTDTIGNFYITTNSVGSGVLGVAGEGALIVVPSDVSTFTFAQGIGVFGSSFRDVAINPITNVPFAIVDDGLSPISGGGDLLVAFPEAVTQPAVGIAQLSTDNLFTDGFSADNLSINGIEADSLLAVNALTAVEDVRTYLSDFDSLLDSVESNLQSLSLSDISTYGIDLQGINLQGIDLQGIGEQVIDTAMAALSEGAAIFDSSIVSELIDDNWVDII
ncbi:MAG: hypothetical protein WA783_12410 [Phormidesmis sp.]